MSDQLLKHSSEDEISLKDIISFFGEFWKIILGVCVISMLGAVVFFAVTPDKYQATALIQPAQLLTEEGRLVNAEDPALIIAKIKSPSSYGQKSLIACGFHGNYQGAEGLTNMLKVGMIKGSQVLELKVTGLSQEQSTHCAHSIFVEIKQSQQEVVEPIIENAKKKLAFYEEQLQQSKAFAQEINKKSDTQITAAYLANRDDHKHFISKKNALEDMITSATIYQTKLVVPIHFSGNVISPKLVPNLIMSFISGLFLGLLMAVGLRAFRSYKSIK